MRALRYAFDEAVASLWRGRQAGLLSTATIALALFVLGGFLLVTATSSGSAPSGAAPRRCRCISRTTPRPPSGARSKPRSRRATSVAAREFVSKTDALARFKQTFSDLAATVDTLGDNPLPASYRSAPAAGGRPPAPTRRRARARGYGRCLAWPTSATTASGSTRLAVRDRHGSRRSGWCSASVLTIAAALTVANVVRLALYARRDELEIMELVGAPQAYIRGPFVMEGVLQGGIGATAGAAGARRSRFWRCAAAISSPLAAAMNLSSIQFLPLELCALLVVGGMAVGCLGGLVAAWNARAERPLHNLDSGFAARTTLD